MIFERRQSKKRIDKWCYTTEGRRKKNYNRKEVDAAR